MSVRRIGWGIVVWSALLGACAADVAPPGQAVGSVAQALVTDADVESVTLSARADTTVALSRPRQGFGDAGWLPVARDLGELRMALVAFDADAIRSAVQGGELLSASLELTVESDSVRRATTLAAYRMLRPWTEEGATFVCADEQSTRPRWRWRERCARGDRWGMGVLGWLWPRPHAMHPSDEAPVDPADDSIVLDVTADLQALLASGEPDHGWLLRPGVDERRAGVRLVSTEGGGGPRLALEIMRAPSCEPTAELDLCDGMDEDCDGEIDEDCVRVGSPCASADDCAALGPRALCDTSAPGGYCSLPCMANPTCPAGSFCFQEAICVVQCEADGSCRDPRLTCGSLGGIPGDYCRPQ